GSLSPQEEESCTADGRYGNGRRDDQYEGTAPFSASFTSASSGYLSPPFGPESESKPYLTPIVYATE
ncbi:MAG: hypothetical protein LBI08_00700, partial [Methanomassiliicoccaceae archaeon]|nr:hypothetical protein [Methanomassiliicoccaceae archaeon]